MGDIIPVELLDDAPGLGFLSLGHRIPVNVLEHKGPQRQHGTFDFGGHFNHRPAHGGLHHIGDQGVDPLGMGIAKDGRNLRRNVLVAKDPRPHGVVNVVVDVGDPVRKPDNLSLQGLRLVRAAVAQDAPADLIGQIQAQAVLFQLVHHPQRLLVVVEGDPHDLRQCRLSCMAEGSMAQVVTHGGCLGQVFIQAQGSGNGPGDPGYLQSMGHPGPVMVALRLQKHLGLMHQAAEAAAVEDAVRVPLVAGAVLPLRFRSPPPTALRSLGGPGGQIHFFPLFNDFSDGHFSHPLYCSQRKQKFLYN